MSNITIPTVSISEACQYGADIGQFLTSWSDYQGSLWLGVGTTAEESIVDARDEASIQGIDISTGVLTAHLVVTP